MGSAAGPVTRRVLTCVVRAAAGRCLYWAPVRTL